MTGWEAAIDRLSREDLLGQLLERRGLASELATENGDIKLDWVDQLAWAVDHPDVLHGLERLATDLAEQGFRHLIWTGMGASVSAVQALKELGVLDSSALTIHPLNSTDPAALNRVLEAVSVGQDLGSAIGHTLMIAVSMGMTSEEPITHLKWFAELLRRQGLSETTHALVMTLSGSLLGQFASETGIRQMPIQLNGDEHIPGRMSSPSTHVFLLPAALALGRDGGLVDLVRTIVVAHDPYLRLAAWLSAQMDEGRGMVLLDVPPNHSGIALWVEQVVEESLGKNGRGLLVFHDQDFAAAAEWKDSYAIVTVDGGSGWLRDERPIFELQTGLVNGGGTANQLAAAGRFFAGWNLAVAALGYLQRITFAGQPAVEGYKRYARQLRDSEDALPYPDDHLATIDSLDLYYEALASAGIAEDELVRRATAFGDGPSAMLAATIAILAERGRLRYIDITWNGCPDALTWDRLRVASLHLGNRVMKIPIKLRVGPRDYHSTEQSETDGPPDLLSIRLLPRTQEPVVAGSYDSRFLHAQALGSLMAMRDAGRPVLLALFDRDEALAAIDHLINGAAALLEES